MSEKVKKGRSLIRLGDFVNMHIWKDTVQIIWKSGKVKNTIWLSHGEFEEAANIYFERKEKSV